jgi:GTP-binding protein
MSLPAVAIVGRPNVGKSSLLNALVGRRISIVDPAPGVTRDRVSSPCPLGEGYVELVDTGGMGIDDVDELTEHVENQIAYAIAEAAAIIFLVDAREGLTPLDRLVAERLRKLGKPVVLAANKVDHPNLATEWPELVGLGFGEPIRVSAHAGLGLHELTDALARTMAPLPAQQPAEPVMKLAIVGRRNTGKSSFINALVGQERVIVSEKPGTTRDSVDVTFQLDGRTFMVIDTAGVRKKRQMVQANLEFYGHHRALRSIRRADVVALMLDASVPAGQVDKDLGAEVAEEFKPVVLVVNKWDLAREKASGEDYQDYLAKVFPFLTYAPMAMTSATEGLNVKQTVLLAEQLFRQANHRVTTGELNRCLEEITTKREPSAKHGTKPPKIYYASQIGTAPPTIVCFVNEPSSFTRDYERFLLNQLRDRLPFPEVPIRLLFRPHRKKGQPREEEP